MAFLRCGITMIPPIKADTDMANKTYLDDFIITGKDHSIHPVPEMIEFFYLIHCLPVSLKAKIYSLF